MSDSVRPEHPLKAAGMAAGGVAILAWLLTPWGFLSVLAVGGVWVAWRLFVRLLERAG